MVIATGKAGGRGRGTWLRIGTSAKLAQVCGDGALDKVKGPRPLCMASRLE